MTHFMIDIETTGLNPGVNHITSCAIVPFSLETGQYGENIFHERFETNIVGRGFSNDTMRFRTEHNIDENEAALLQANTLFLTMKNIKEFLFIENKDSIIVWAKPSHFDIAFLESYFRQTAMTIPWSHRNVRDLATYLMAAGHNLTDLYEEVKFTGDTHNAQHDCQYQILLANLGYRSLNK